MAAWDDSGRESGDLHCCAGHQVPFGGHGSPLPFELAARRLKTLGPGGLAIKGISM